MKIKVDDIRKINIENFELKNFLEDFRIFM